MLLAKNINGMWGRRIPWLQKLLLHTSASTYSAAGCCCVGVITPSSRDKMCDLLSLSLSMGRAVAQ